MLEKDTLRLISLMLFAIYTSTTVYGDTDSQSKKLTDFAFKNKVGNQDYLLQIETSYGWEAKEKLRCAQSIVQQHSKIVAYRVV